MSYDYHPGDSYGSQGNPSTQPSADYDGQGATVYAPASNTYQNYAEQPSSQPSAGYSQNYAQPAHGQSTYAEQPYPQTTGGYGQQDYSQNAYAANPYSGQAGAVQAYSPYGVVTPPDHPQSTTVLVLGIVGLFVVQICAPIAWFIGSKARKEISAEPGRYGGSGTLTAGWVMGIIGTVILGLEVVGFIFWIIVFVLVAAQQ